MTNENMGSGVESWVAPDPRMVGEHVAKAWDTKAKANGEFVNTLGRIANAHATQLFEQSRAGMEKRRDEFGELASRWTTHNLGMDLLEYMTDLSQRQILFLDVLRQRGNNFIAHEEDRAPLVLAFDCEVIVDGRDFARPVNYSLVRIVPPEGMATRQDGRPYIIIDPRAGHGSGIGGFKDASEVGCALKEGHPTS